MPDVVINPDPFSMVHDALWVMVERNQNILDMVKPGNRIKFDKQNEPLQRKMDADLPELILVPGGGTYGGKDNSTQSTVVRTYEWQIATGDIRLQPIYNKLMFEMYRSMIDWNCVLCPLLWCDCPFVNGFRMIQHIEGQLSTEQNKSIPGWSALWTCEVDFSFPRKLLLLPQTVNS